MMEIRWIRLLSSWPLVLSISFKTFALIDLINQLHANSYHYGCATMHPVHAPSAAHRPGHITRSSKPSSGCLLGAALRIPAPDPSEGASELEPSCAPSVLPARGGKQCGERRREVDYQSLVRHHRPERRLRPPRRWISGLLQLHPERRQFALRAAPDLRVSHLAHRHGPPCRGWCRAMHSDDTSAPRLRAEICRAAALGLRELRRCRRTARDAGHPNSSAGALRCSVAPSQLGPPHSRFLSAEKAADFNWPGLRHR